MVTRVLRSNVQFIIWDMALQAMRSLARQLDRHGIRRFSFSMIYLEYCTLGHAYIADNILYCDGIELWIQKNHCLLHLGGSGRTFIRKTQKWFLHVKSVILSVPLPTHSLIFYNINTKTNLYIPNNYESSNLATSIDRSGLSMDGCSTIQAWCNPLNVGGMAIVVRVVPLDRFHSALIPHRAK